MFTFVTVCRALLYFLVIVLMLGFVWFGHDMTKLEVVLTLIVLFFICYNIFTSWPTNIFLPISKTEEIILKAGIVFLTVSIGMSLFGIINTPATSGLVVIFFLCLIITKYRLRFSCSKKESE